MRSFGKIITMKKSYNKSNHCLKTLSDGGVEGNSDLI